jgi:predicted aspartyl protease
MTCRYRYIGYNDGVTQLRSTRALLVSAALLMLSCPIFAQSRPMTLAALLRLHDQATQFPTVRHSQTTQETVYALEASGLTGTLTEYDAPGHKNRVEMALGPIRQTTGDDGHTAWQEDTSGNVRVLSGSELAESRASQSFTLEAYDPAHDAKLGSLTLRPKRDAQTGDYVIDLMPKDGSPQTVYLDPHTYLTRRMVSSQEGITGAIQILSYRRIEGEELPAQMQISYAGLPVSVNAHLVSATRGLPLSSALFAQPSTKTPDFQFLTADGQGPATVSYTNQDGEIMVDTMVNGQPRHLLLDSGAGSSFLTGQAAQGLHLTLHGGIPAIGYGGATHTGIATHALLELPGAVRLPNLTVYVLQDPSVAQAMSQHGILDGALGYDLFSRVVVTIDYAAKTLTLTDPEAYTPPSGATVIPLQLNTRTPSVLASVDGRAPARFIIDTGDNAVIHLYQKYAQASHLEPSAHDPNAQVLGGIGVGGTIREVITLNHTLKIGGQTLNGLPIAFIPNGGITNVLHQAGGIGFGVLSHFVVTFDYPHNRLILETPQAPATPLGFLFSNPIHAATHWTTASVLQRHLKSLGGQTAVAGITSTRVVADVVTGGLHGTVTTIYASPENEYEEDKIGILDVTQGYDGTTAWRRDSNGNIRLLGPNEVQNLRNQLYFDTNSYVIPGPVKGTITLRPKRDPATGDFVLDAVPQGGKPTTISLNAKTFLIDREQHKDDDVMVTTTFKDYRKVNGVEFPFAQHTTNGDKRYDLSLTVKTIDNNGTIAPTLFQKPIEDSQADFVIPGATSATVPFDFSDGEIALDITLNGQPERVFLDSGSSGVAISKATADALHLPQTGFLEARGYGGSADLIPVKVASFGIPGAIHLTDVSAVAIPLSPALNSFLTTPIAGFVGYDLFSHFVIRIDFSKHQITFIAPESFQPTPSDGRAVPIALDDDIPTLTAQLDSMSPARFLVDTGDSGQLRLYGPYVAKNALDQKYPGGTMTVGGGVGGASLSRVARVDRFTVGDITLHGIPTDFSLDKKGGASEIDAGSMGVALLSRFIVTFDYPHQRIFFAPGPDITAPFNTRTLGISVGLGGLPQHVIITAIEPNAPAHSLDIHVGDLLLSVDGVSSDQLSLPSVRSLLSGADGKTQHLLQVQTGTAAPRSVTVPLYDPLATGPTLP